MNNYKKLSYAAKMKRKELGISKQFFKNNIVSSYTLSKYEKEETIPEPDKEVRIRFTTIPFRKTPTYN